jgi:hypothetical protein
MAEWFFGLLADVKQAGALGARIMEVQFHRVFHHEIVSSRVFDRLSALLLNLRDSM